MSEVQEIQLDQRGKERRKYQTFNTEESRTVQSDRDRADIRKIMQKFRQVGVVDHMAAAAGVYKDVSAFDDYQDVMLSAKSAEEKFMELPSKLREVFGHDVAEWLDCAHDKEKMDAKIPELVKGGWIEAVEASSGGEGDPSSPPATAEEA